ncbi:MAG: UDP-N-acetylmuramoyl-tripeptide--D-alanyl-D-alanine ligase [bacterium]|nr:UDP-N-acetylmuramoyl-tripeptide--D-alanyl-D-alanine ligase [bacterium]
MSETEVLEPAGFLIIALASLVFYSRRSLGYLRYLQQEEYMPGRFARWWVHNRVFDRRGSIVAIPAAGVCFLVGRPAVWLVVDVVAAFLLVAVAFRETDPRKEGKVRLNMTARATRIYRTAFTCHGVLLIAILLVVRVLPMTVASGWLWLFQVLLIQGIPVTIVVGNALLQPGERARQQGFMKEARAILGQVEPFVVGITGSYGKTSTKAVLGVMLDTVGPTFWPPRSINTPMGITREIRERLKGRHRYAVIEMGAYMRGSIRRLCDLVPPHAGIITTVGIMHLERFGSPENVFLAKSELAQAIPADGIFVVNGDDEGARRMAEENPKKQVLVYGLNAGERPLDCWMSNVAWSPEGTTFTAHWQGREYPGFTRVLGRPMLSNILAAFTMACTLGADPEVLMAIIRNLEPVDNRLQAVYQGGTLYLKDAYSSNPVGFAAALEVLESMPAERRILMTPGMVELGPRQEQENRRAAENAARICDLAFVVGSINRQPLMEGLHRGDMTDEQISFFDDRDGALRNLEQIQRPDDVVLIENDLPDLLEILPSF